MMELFEAFGRLRDSSPEERILVLNDQLADETLRGVAALTLAKLRDLSVLEKVRLLGESLDSATTEVKKYIAQALGYCCSADAIGLLNEQLCDAAIRPHAMDSLARLGDSSILPLCQQLINSESDEECRSALSSLSRLGSAEAISLLETAVQSALSAGSREFASFLLALKGIAVGEVLLEQKLAYLRAPEVQSSGEAKVALKSEYVNVAVALAEIKNKNGLLAIERMLGTLVPDDANIQYLKGLMIGRLRLPPTIAFSDWKTAVLEWIDSITDTME